MTSTSKHRARRIGTGGRHNAPRASTLHLLALILFAGGCGSSAPQAEAPPAPEGGALEAPSDDPDPKKKHERDLSPAERERHIDDALREVEVAERTLETELKKREPEVAPRPGEPTPTPRSSDRGCETACSTLGSMQRAAAYVCRLAGEGDARCRAAQDRVRVARTKIQQAACACAEPVASIESDHDQDESFVAGLRPVRLHRFFARR